MSFIWLFDHFKSQEDPSKGGNGLFLSFNGEPHARLQMISLGIQEERDNGILECSKRVSFGAFKPVRAWRVQDSLKVKWKPTPPSQPPNLLQLKTRQGTKH